MHVLTEAKADELSQYVSTRVGIILVRVGYILRRIFAGVDMLWTPALRGNCYVLGQIVPEPSLKQSTFT